MASKVNWYYRNSGPDAHQQALVIDEDGGRNVAVVYDRKDAPMLSAAPDLLAACEGMARDADFDENDGAMELGERLLSIEATARAAIKLARE